MNFDENAVRAIVRDVLQQMGGGNAPHSFNIGTPSPKSGADGIFDDVSDAADAAYNAFQALSKGGFAARQKICDLVKKVTVANAKEWGTFEFNETKIGKLEHKIGKLEIIKGVPATEWIRPDAWNN